MAIRYRPQGMTELYGKLGKLAGESVAAQKQIQFAQGMAEKVMSMKQEQDQQRQQQETQLKREQLAIKANEEADIWEFEKMKLRSQNDFALEEAKHQAEVMSEIKQEQGKRDKYNAVLNRLQDMTVKGEITENKAKELSNKAYMTYMGYGGLNTGGEEKRGATQGALEKIMGELATGKQSSGRFMSPIKNKEEYAIMNLGPNWRLEYPEAIPYVDGGTSTPSTPREVPSQPAKSQNLPQPRTQTEYDALPSGTEYIDTDGAVKRKR